MALPFICSSYKYLKARRRLQSMRHNVSFLLEVLCCRFQQASRQNLLPPAMRCDSNRHNLDTLLNSDQPSEIPPRA